MNYVIGSLIIDGIYYAPFFAKKVMIVNPR